MNFTFEDDKVKDKISETDKTTIIDKCNDTIKWLDGNKVAEKDESAHKQKVALCVCVFKSELSIHVIFSR